MTDRPSSTPTPVVDEDEVLYCYRHPTRETALRCNNCERPICIDCSMTAAVGLKCPECARQPRAALAKVPTPRLAAGVAAGVAAGFVGGFLYNGLSFGFFGLIVAWLLGIGIAEVVRFATGGFRDPLVGRVAAACALVGLSLPVVMLILRVGVDALQSPGNVFTVLGAIIASVAAYNRVS